MIKEISAREIEDRVRELFLSANRELPNDVLCALEKAKATEKSPVARTVLDDILENARLARSDRVAICQDTGVSYVFIELGQDVHVVGGSLREAVNSGVARAYRDGYFRASVVSDPIFDRKNTRNNTPAILYVDVVLGDRLRIVVMPKGTGSENMGALKMMVPADGPQGIKQFTVETVERAGPNPCPPIIVGVGVGGMMDGAALLAKKALLRQVSSPNSDPAIAKLESDILKSINALGLGAGGLGGTVTALAVHIETMPTHIGAMPVAVCLQCHAARHAECLI